jgi:predicted protein tyrosine phosphatase
MLDQDIKFKIFSEQLSEMASVVDANTPFPHIWISIRSRGTSKPNIHLSETNKGILFLEFHDITSEEMVPKEGSGKTWKLFDDDQANEIIDFVEEHLNDIFLICVNCEAGMSRSAGCAEALSLLLNKHDSGIGTNPEYFPNVHVKSLILKHGERLREDHE